MPLMSAARYLDSLRELKRDIYILGQKVEDVVDNPMVRPSLNAVAETYALAQDPRYRELFTARSRLTGNPVNRFCHLHQGTTDLVNKVKMLRIMGQKTASCFQRCVGMDALNAVDTITFEMDQALGTSYSSKFRAYLARTQEDDLVVAGAMTDPKGDRSLRPFQLADPDLYLHVVEKSADGIVVRGAKAHQTGILSSHEVLVMPTVTMGEEDRDYAVCFAVPADTKGMLYIYGRQSCDTRKLEGGEIDVGNARYGAHEALVVFEDVFVPWDRVFMCGEYRFSGTLVERFAGYHRQSYGGCKAG
ncbi:MAG TPA: 4-hydroxybutyryl-CoA dehydratase, partial [Clostridiales bacterium]|nr:4-hydroxybutyryl-CoA dehydratase [Clostridiales bacterium]